MIPLGLARRLFSVANDCVLYIRHLKMQICREFATYFAIEFSFLETDRFEGYYRNMSVLERKSADKFLRCQNPRSTEWLAEHVWHELHRREPEDSLVSGSRSC
jgi:hypothetical protein